MKVFYIDDCTWYAAETLEDAIRKFTEDTGLKPEDLRDDPPHELNAAKMGETMYVEHGFPGEDYEIPFSRALELMIKRGDEFPCIFATTEW